jgi:hypothetical protein
MGLHLPWNRGRTTPAIFLMAGARPISTGILPDSLTQRRRMGPDFGALRACAELTEVRERPIAKERSLGLDSDCREHFFPRKIGEQIAALGKPRSALG